MFEQLINHFFKYEFVYVFIFISLSFLLIAIIAKKQTLKIIFMLLFSIFFSLFVVEIFLSLQMPLPKTQFPKEITEQILNNNIDVLKLTKNKHLRFDINGKEYHNGYMDFIKNDNDKRVLVYDVYETTYQNMFRYTKSDLSADKKYVFLGCSFMYGLGLEDNQTLPYCFSKMLNYECGVLNCGVAGVGSNTVLNILQSNIVGKFIKQNKKIEKFIYLAMTDHPIRNFTDHFLGKSSDNYIYEKDEFIKTEQPFEIFIGTFAKSYIFKKIFLNLIEDKNKDFYEEYFINSLLKMNDIIENQYNSKFTVLLWMGEGLKFEKNFIEKLQNIGLDILVLPEIDASYFIPNDGHPNEKANKEIAEILLKHFQEQDKKI